MESQFECFLNSQVEQIALLHQVFFGTNMTALISTKGKIRFGLLF